MIRRLQKIRTGFYNEFSGRSASRSRASATACREGTSRPMNAPSAARFAPSRRWVTPLLAAFVLAGSFNLYRFNEPLFVDEAAFLSQSYFWDLAVTGRRDDPQ